MVISFRKISEFDTAGASRAMSLFKKNIKGSDCSIIFESIMFRILIEGGAMFKAKHTTFHYIAGSIWLIVGTFLMIIGIRFLMDSAFHPENGSFLIKSLEYAVGGSEQGACILVAMGLFLGSLKVRYVLYKAVTRLSSKILTLPNPAHAKFVFTFRYFVLIFAMMGIGFLMKLFELPSDIRGVVDVAVGSGLVSGSLYFFKLGRALSICDTASSA